MPTRASSTGVRSRVSAAAVVVLTAATLIVLPSSAPTSPRDGAGTVVVSGGTLVDGTGREPLPDATIVLRDGRVAEVTAGGVAGPPAGTESIDARGKWIVPGLIDVHVHYHPGWMDALFLRHGVTTVRDVGSGLDAILELREASRAPGVARPRLFACGPLIDGPSPRHGTGISVSVQTVAEARAVARRLLDRGVDCLKIYEQLTPPLVEAVVREADGTRVPVTAHLRDTTALRALEIGVRGLEHAFGFEACDETVAAQVVRRAVERGAYVVPTLAITEQISRFGSPEQETMALLGEIPAARRQYWRATAAGASPDRTAGAARRLGCLKLFVARLQRAGGHVVAGSDTSNPYVVPGASLHRELELLVEAGLSPREALAAATRTAAAFLGQARTLGTLEVGKTADLVVLGADPLASIAAIRQIEVVIRDGRVVWRR
jgi:imidazolonepropionase-like amidohydrolase